MRRGAPVAVLCALLLGSRPIFAQHLPASAFAPRQALHVQLPGTAAGLLPGAGGAAGTVPLGIVVQDEVGTRAPWWAPIASAAVPGSGQLVMRQRRGVPFLAAEAFLLVQFLSVRDDAKELRREYQRLAQIARSFFTDEYPAGDFEYYERMQQFVESGAYSLDPNGGFQPETDTATFNGFTWRLARQTFWEDPNAPPPQGSDAYLRAIEFYEERAVRDQFRWSWQNAQLEQDLFSQTIERSNSAFRRASQYLGTLIANHALSAIDAFVLVRLARTPGPAGEYRIEGQVPWAPLGRGGGSPPSGVRE